MSSPKTIAAKASRRSARGARVGKARSTHGEGTPVGGKRAAKLEGEIAAATLNGSPQSTQAKRLAADMERALAGGRRDMLTPDALQALMAAVCRTYAAQVEAGEAVLPLPKRGGATATEVMITASGLLKAANLAVFELGMWQSWTGR